VPPLGVVAKVSSEGELPPGRGPSPAAPSGQSERVDLVIVERSLQDLESMAETARAVDGDART
jgi:hypothetical protein